jgi:membrane associated rhomboid family serine protease
MSSLWQDIRYKALLSGSQVKLLIGINVGVFLLFSFIFILEKLSTGSTLVSDLLIDYLAVPANLQQLLYRFWTPFTYMFLHAGIFHILFNMLWLYWLGKIFEEYLGGKKLVTVYILGGLAGAILYILSYNFFPLFETVKLTSYAVGASAGVIAIVVATATLLPDYSIGLLFLGPVKLKWIAVFYVLISFLGVAGSNAGGNIAHIGGALLGFIYIKQLRSDSKLGLLWRKIFPGRKTLRVVHRNNQQTTLIPTQEEVDILLDKINVSGFKSLTKKERSILEKASKGEKKS